jgi:hypothetical protein
VRRGAFFTPGDGDSSSAKRNVDLLFEVVHYTEQSVVE